MTLDALLRRWTDQSRLDADRAGRIAAYRDERPLSLYWEIRALLYAGVLLILAGVGQTIRAHFANLTDTAVIGGLAAGAALLFGYVVRRAPPFAKTATESPASFFDAALFLACGLLSADAAYAQWRFQWMGRAWDAYLLSAAALFGWLSYR